MIIVRTPYRISFFGGGTDYKEYYAKNKNAGVISTSIDKYCYISVRELPNYFEHKNRLCYSKIEHFDHIHEIEHPSARSVLSLFENSAGLEIHHDGDVPAGSGLGTSSAFVIGLLNAMYAFHNIQVNRYELASKAIYVEQVLNKEFVGSQDQIATCYGGLNKISFSKEDQFSVMPLNISSVNKNYLLDHCLLYYTGIQRLASDLEKQKFNDIEKITNNLDRITEIKISALKFFQDDNFDVEEIGKLLNATWHEKKGLSEKISLPSIDEAYEVAMKKGAYGGKILGAGGGGFLLFLAPPKFHRDIDESLKKLTKIKFNFDNIGTSIILNKNPGIQYA